MAKVRVFYNPDNTVLLTYFNFNIKPDGDTDVVFMDRESAKLGHSALPSFDVEDTDLPDREATTRSAWRANSSTETVSAS